MCSWNFQSWMAWPAACRVCLGWRRLWGCHSSPGSSGGWAGAPGESRRGSWQVLAEEPSLSLQVCCRNAEHGKHCCHCQVGLMPFWDYLKQRPDKIKGIKSNCTYWRAFRHISGRQNQPRGYTQNWTMVTDFHTFISLDYLYIGG